MVPPPELLLRDTAWLAQLTRRLCGDDDRAADLQQEVVCAALRQPDRAALGRSWLAAVARNLAAMWRRGAARERRRLQALPGREPVPSAAELAATAELQQRAVALVLALPAVQRDTVLLRFLRGLSVAATAAAMGVPEQTVRTRQKRALATLRQQLAPAREDRGRTAIAVCLAATGAVMKLKHAVAAVALLLLSLLVLLPAWSARRTPVAAPPPPPAIAAAADAARTAPPAAAAARSELPPADPRPEAAATAGELSVRVRWRDGGAAAGVPVRCGRMYETGAFATTDAAGMATFAALPAGRYTVGAHDWSEEVATVTPGGRETVELTIQGDRAVDVLVVDPRGAPVAGAEILVSNGGTLPQWRFALGRSDAQGRCTCRGLRAQALVGASHPTLGTSPFRLLLDARAQTAPEAVQLRLPGTAMSLRGRVVDDAGHPVAGAWVQLGAISLDMRVDAAGDLWQPPPAWLGRSAADGSFAADGLAAGSCPLLVHGRGFAPHRATPTLQSGMAPLVVVLQPGAALAGSVRDGNGQPLAGAEVELEDGDYPLPCSQRTGSDGSFRIEDLPPGESVFLVSHRDFPRQQATRTFAGGEVQRWDVVLTLGPVIRGRLVDERGQPLAGWRVLVAGGDRLFASDADGRFVVTECAAEANQLRVFERWGFHPYRLRLDGVRAAEAEQTFVVGDVTAPSAHLRGRCLGAGELPLAGASLQLSQDRWPVTDLGDGIGADGSFDLGPLPPGRYQLFVDHPQFVFALLAVELRAGEVRELGPLRGQRPAQLRVHLSGDATACAAAAVQLRGDAPQRAGEGDGSERSFLRVLPGRYRLVVVHDGRELDAGEVELQPGADLRREVALP